MNSPSAPAGRTPRVGLFVTCLVDLIRPSVGFAAVKLLEDAGCVVEVPSAQTCCGQPAFNSGNTKDAAKIAQQVITTFEPFEYVVAPSGSCAGMLKAHFPELFPAGDPWRVRAEVLAGRVHELVSFLTDVCGVTDVEAHYEHTVTYHDSCSGLRELDVKAQPRALLKSVKGLRLKEMDGCEECCGFGGTFSVKYPDVSNSIVEKKTRNIEASHADVLLAGDMGCLLNMAGKLKRQGSTKSVRHVAEVLAGMTDTPAIGEAPQSEN